MQPQPAPGGERVDGDVAALGDERDGAGLARRDHVAPQRDAVGQADDPVAVGPADRQPVPARRVDQAVWSASPSRASANPAANTTAPPQPSAPASSTTSGAVSAGIATTTASGASGSVASDAKHSSPCTRSRPGLTA